MSLSECMATEGRIKARFDAAGARRLLDELAALRGGGSAQQQQEEEEEEEGGAAAAEPPPARAFSVALWACADAGLSDEAVALVLGGDSDSSSDFDPALADYNAALNACKRAGRSEAALEVLEAMRARGDADAAPNGASFVAAIRSCRRLGAWERATDLLEQMRDAGATDAGPRKQAYAAAIETCTNAVQWQQAVELVEAMRAEEVPRTPHAYTQAIHTCGRAGEWEPALALLRAAQADEGTAVTARLFNAALAACVGAGESGAAAELLDELDGVTGAVAGAVAGLEHGLEGVVPDALTERLAFRAYAGSAELAECSRLVFGNAPVTHGVRSGRKLLRKKLIGPALVAWYPRSAESLTKLDPNFRTAKQRRRALQLDKLKRRGKGPPKKGEGSKAMKGKKK
jgi:small subunit ribosomal protein S33